MMTRIKLYTILTMMVTLLNGCVVYYLDVPQGNEITQGKVNKLQVGLTKPQVQYLLGTSLLQDPFHANRWDYVYADIRKGKIKQEKRFTVFFENDRLVRWEGDVLPMPENRPLRTEKTTKGMSSDASSSHSIPKE